MTTTTTAIAPAQTTSTAKLGKRARPAIVAAVVALAALTHHVYARRFVETDDAQIDGDISNVSARVGGDVARVDVAENQVVHAGDPLAELDPRDLDVEVARARAAVALAQAELAAEDPGVGMTEASNQASLATAASDIASSIAALAAARRQVARVTAELTRARAIARQATQERERAARLLADGAIARAELDARENAATAAEASVVALEHELGEARERIAQEEARIAAANARRAEASANGPRRLEARRAAVLAKRAALDAANAALARAELDATYAKIVAPVDGIVVRKSIAVGDRASSGQQLFAIAQVKDLWVTANYRETQLERVRPGQHVDVYVDALDATLRGTVESIGGSTGARMSLLPPENAAGNYVKVTQRIPVRIRLEPGQPGADRLRPGMSVVPKVRLSAANE
jgi:membrane fusion protein (multidrug efflux system)